MNGTTRLKNFLLLIVLALCGGPFAQADLVTSRLDLTAGQRQITIKSAAAGPVTDSNSVSTQGQSATGKTATGGISFNSLDQYPGSGSFLTTDLFTTRAEAGQSVETAASNASAISSLQRTGRWRVDALRPGLNGAAGVQFIFRYSWAHRVQGSESASINLGYVINGGIDGGDAFTRTLQGSGGLTSSRGTDFWVSAFEVPVDFGIVFTLEWTLSNDAVVSSGAGSSSAAKGSAELWDVQVRDSFGSVLTRFVDYDLVEITDAGSASYRVATGGNLPPRSPVLSVGLDSNHNLTIDFTGDLEQSADLVQWTLVDPTLMGPYFIPGPLTGNHFFRAVLP